MIRKIALLAALCAPTFAFAEPYLVLGGATGHTDLSQLESSYAPLAVESDDGFGRAIIGVGANVTPYVGIEALYLTEAEGTVESRSTSEKDTLKSSGFQFAVLGKAPLTPQFSLFGKLSANYMDVKYDYVDQIAPINNVSLSDSKFQLGYGVGAHFQVNDAVGLRLTAERIQIRDALNGNGDADQDQASLAVTFAF